MHNKHLFGGLVAVALLLSASPAEAGRKKDARAALAVQNAERGERIKALEALATEQATQLAETRKENEELTNLQLRQARVILDYQEAGRYDAHWGTILVGTPANVATLAACVEQAQKPPAETLIPEMTVGSEGGKAVCNTSFREKTSTELEAEKKAAEEAAKQQAAADKAVAKK